MRAAAYGLPTTDRLGTKRVAGNIVPAIATTTSVVAGLSCLELIKVAVGDDVSGSSGAAGGSRSATVLIDCTSDASAPALRIATIEEPSTCAYVIRVVSRCTGGAPTKALKPATPVVAVQTAQVQSVQSGQPAAASHGGELSVTAPHVVPGQLPASADLAPADLGVLSVDGAVDVGQKRAAVVGALIPELLTWRLSDEQLRPPSAKAAAPQPEPPRTNHLLSA